MSERMTDAEIDAIAARADAATPGPWETWGTDVLCGVAERHGDYSRVYHEHGHKLCEFDEYDYYYVESGDDDDIYSVTAQAESDAEFVAYARTDVPALVAEVNRLRAAEARLREMHVAPTGVDEPCAECCEPYPCPTIAVLDGAES